MRQLIEAVLTTRAQHLARPKCPKAKRRHYQAIQAFRDAAGL